MEYKISIVVTGEDRASGPLRNVGSALGNMGQIAGGIMGANLLTGIAQKLQGIASSAIGATAQLQQMTVGMEGLLAREIANTANMQAVANAADGVAASTMSIADAMPQAQAKAKAFIDELANIAVLSPYQVETVQQTFQTALAFGYTADEAKKYTKAILNVAAGSGAGNEQLQRMSYNFAQIRMQGRVTAVDIRQLAMAGFDLVSVLKFTGDQFGVTIKDHNDFNKAIAEGKITWEQFTEAFDKYATTNFGGAAERMSRTLTGLQSTFKDVLTLTMPKLLGPIVERFTGFANKFLDSILKFRNAGLLEKWGANLGEIFGKLIGYLEPLLTFVDGFFTTLAAGAKPLEALRLAIYGAFGGAGLAIFEVWLGRLQEIWAWFTNLYTTISTALLPVLINLWTWVQQNILPLISYKDVLITLGLIILSIVIPAIVSFVGALLSAAAPILAILAVVVLLRNAWEGNWGGIRDTLLAVWANLQPVLAELWTWLQINIPIAIQWLSDLWTNTLYPAIQKIWQFLTVDMMPVWEALGELLSVTLALAITALTGLWQNVLQPALQAIWKFIQDKIIPTIKKWSDGFGGVSGAIEKVVGWIKTLTEKLKNVKLPAWLTPGSPTPFELGLKGINEELERMTRANLPQLTAGLNLGANALSGQSQRAYYDNRQFNLTVPTSQDKNVVVKSFELMKAVENGI